MNYLDKLQRAKSPERIALLIRALSCRHAAGLTSCGEKERLGIVLQGEIHALTIELCPTLEEATRLLREWTYIPALGAAGEE